MDFVRSEWESAGWDDLEEAERWHDAGWEDPVEAYRWYEAGWEDPETALEWNDARWSMEDFWEDPREALRWYKAGGLTPEEALEWHEAGWKWDPEIAGKLNSLLETAIERGEVNYKVIDKAVELMQEIAPAVKRERQRRRGLSP